MDTEAEGFLTADQWLKSEITKRLNYFHGSKTRAALSLGMSRSKLYRRMKTFNVYRHLVPCEHTPGKKFVWTHG